MDFFIHRYISVIQALAHSFNTPSFILSTTQDDLLLYHLISSKIFQIKHSDNQKIVC